MVPEEVIRLLDERSQVQGWLERLGELEDEATPEVFARVESDYRGRLEEVNGRLSSHRADLEESLTAQRDRVSDLQAERDERAAELEEAKLRFSVGEYDDEKWDRRREAAEGAIEGLDGRLEDARAAMGELEGVLAALPGGGAAEAWRSSAADAGRGASAEPQEAEPQEARPIEAEEVAAAGTEAEEGPVAQADGFVAESESSETEETPAGRSQSWLHELEEPPAEAAAGTDVGSAEAARETDQPESRTSPPDEAQADAPDRSATAEAPASDDDFLDELEFLESLSLEDSKRFDAVSAMLEGEEEAEEGDGREGRG